MVCGGREGRVVDCLDDGGGLELGCDGVGEGVDAGDARDEVAAVALEVDGVEGEVVVGVVGVEDGFEGAVHRGRGVEDEAATHDVAVAGEDLGQGGDDDGGVGQDVDVDEVADGFVDYEGDGVPGAEGGEAGQVGGVEEGVGGELGEDGEVALAGVEAGFEVGDVGVGTVAVEEGAGAPFLEDFERVDVGEAEADAFERGSGGSGEEGLVRVEDCGHAGWVEVDVIFGEVRSSGGGRGRSGGVDVEGLIEIGVFTETTCDAATDGELGFVCELEI